MLRSPWAPCIAQVNNISDKNTDKGRRTQTSPQSVYSRLSKMRQVASLTLTLTLLSLGTLSQAKDCGDGKIRGVNLGGWLLLEPWISPRFFEEANPPGFILVVDEWTFAEYVEPGEAARRLDR